MALFFSFGNYVLTGNGLFPWAWIYWSHLLPLRAPKGFPGGSAGKESACNAGALDSIPGLGRSPREGNGYPVQCFGLENFMDCIVHGVSKSQTGLNNFHCHFQSPKSSNLIFQSWKCHKNKSMWECPGQKCPSLEAGFRVADMLNFFHVYSRAPWLQSHPCALQAPSLENEIKMFSIWIYGWN